jgi:predicted metal-dependent peptidase
MPKHSKETAQAIARLSYKQPLFAQILFDVMTIKEDPSTKTAATDGRTIWVGDWFRKLNLNERVFVLAHEISHAIFLHMPRAKRYQDRGVGPDLTPFSPKRWNVAGDYYINYLLVDGNVGTMPKVGLYDSHIYGGGDVVIDDIYCGLPEDTDDDSMDEHIIPGNDPEQSISADRMKQAVSAAMETAKQIGKLPGGLQRALGELLEPTQTWKQLLRDYLTSSVGKDDASWARPNRRRLAVPPHVPFPGTEGHAMGTLVIAIDTSGSIGQREMSAFISELSAIVEDVRPRELWVAWWDTSCVLQRLESMDELDTDELRPVGGGGTDFACVGPAIDDELIDPELCVVMTDGAVSWPSDFNYPVLTVSTTTYAAPWGRTIHMDLNQDGRL